MVSAHVVPVKGAVIDWVIQQCARDLERLGHYGQITLVSDQEPAIVDVLREIANFRGSRGTLLEHSPVADTQSKHSEGAPSRSTHRCSHGLSSTQKMFLNKCHVASDGKSAYERSKKRPHREEFLPFGAAVMFRIAEKVPGGVMTKRWHLGTWLGKRFHTEEHIVARKGDGLVIRS